MQDLSDWRPRPRPAHAPIEGRYVRLEPLDADRHADDLFAQSSAPDAAERFRWLPEEPPASPAVLEAWAREKAASADPLYFAVIERATGRALGRQTLMRIDPANGVIEIGNIYWGPSMARTPLATEAQFLFARHVFDDLGYRRYEWKCNDRNAPSKRAALRFGFEFEGVFRQHMVVKGENRDTAWYAILDGAWPRLRRAYESWLDPANFDPEGRQRRRLEAFTSDAGSG